MDFRDNRFPWESMGAQAGLSLPLKALFKNFVDGSVYFACVHRTDAPSELLGDTFGDELVEQVVRFLHFLVQFLEVDLHLLRFLLLLGEGQLHLHRLLGPGEHQLPAAVVHAQVVDEQSTLFHVFQVRQAAKSIKF